MSAAYRAWAARTGETRLRLDANQAWDLHDATAFARAVADLPVDYLEEPLKTPPNCPSSRATPARPLHWTKPCNPACPGRRGSGTSAPWSSKPTALGEFARAREIGAAAAAAGAKSVSARSSNPRSGSPTSPISPPRWTTRPPTTGSTPRARSPPTPSPRPCAWRTDGCPPRRWTGSSA
ncbi:MAG: enolase C-terminal domain-like protein [Kiritimatiellia bacterium]